MKIDGKQIASEILENLKKRVGELKKKKIIPKLTIIILGNDPASLAYVRQKELKAKGIGIKTTILHLPDKTSQTSLLKKIQQFNNDSNIHGIIVQQPLPTDISLESIINAIELKKDVDGFHPDSHFQMPIAMAVLKILERTSEATELACLTGVAGTKTRHQTLIDWLKTKKIIIVGKGETGGKPIAKMFEKMKIPFTTIDSKTEKPKNLTKKADIIITAVGKENIIKPQMIKKGVILIDIGISRGKSAKLMGDYDQSKIKNIASFYTPTPGGIGPINVAMLLQNLVLAEKN